MVPFELACLLLALIIQMISSIHRLGSTRLAEDYPLRLSDISAASNSPFFFPYKTVILYIHSGWNFNESCEGK